MESINEHLDRKTAPAPLEGDWGGIDKASPTISLLSFLELVLARRRFIANFTLVCLVVAATIAFLLPHTYTATTSILPPQQGNSFSTALLSQLGNLGSLAGASGLSPLKSPNDLYVGLLKSETVENSFIHRFHLQDDYHTRLLSDTRKALEGHVSIDATQKDGLIRISLNSQSPSRAAELANGYIEEYRHLSASLAIGEASQRRLFLENQLSHTKETLAASEEDLKRTEQSTGMIQLDSQARMLIETAGSLRAQIATKEVQIHAMESYAGPGNAELLQAQQELAGLQAQLARLTDPRLGTSADLMPSKGSLTQEGLEYVRKVREVKYNETIFEILARQYEAAKLDEAREGSIIQVVDIATIPDRKSGPPRLFIILGGFVAGLFLSTSWILVQRIHDYLLMEPGYVRVMNQISSKNSATAERLS